MKLLGMGFHYDELKVGDRFKTVGRTMFETDIMNFVGVTGMAETLFTSLEYIEHHSPTGKRIGPAVLVLGLAEGLVLPAMLQGVGMALLTYEVDMKAPLVVGDTIHVEVEITEIRKTQRGNRGLVRSENKVINQQGEVVMVYRPLRMIRGLPEQPVAVA